MPEDNDGEGDRACELHLEILQRLEEADHRMERLQTSVLCRLEALETAIQDISDVKKSGSRLDTCTTARDVPTARPRSLLRQLLEGEGDATHAAAESWGIAGKNTAGPVCEGDENVAELLGLREGSRRPTEAADGADGAASVLSPLGQDSSANRYRRTITTRPPSILRPIDPENSAQSEFMERLQAYALQERMQRGLNRKRTSQVGRDDSYISNSSAGDDSQAKLMRLQIHHTYSKANKAFLSGPITVPSVARKLLSPIHPLGNFARLWAIVLLMISYISLYTIPFWIAFGLDDRGRTAGLVWASFRMVVYLLDIAMGFRVSYITDTFDSEGNEYLATFELGMVMQYSKIAMKYARSWLIPDLIMLVSATYNVMIIAGYIDIPLDLSSGSYILSSLFMIPILCKQYKLLFNEAMIRMRKKANAGLGSGIYRLLTVVVYMSLLVHFTSCIFHFIAAVNEYDEFTWVAAQGLEDASIMRRYLQALYWSITTLTTVGYGDVLPIGVGEKIFTVLTMTLGIGSFAYLLSSMSALAVSLNQRQNQEKEWMAKMESFIDRHNVPDTLATRLLLYQEFLKDRNLPGADQDIMENLSDTLRTQVELFLSSQVIQSLPVLSQQPPMLLAQLIKVFTLRLHAPGDVVMVEGEISQEMYFLSGGFLEVWVSTSLFSRKKQKITLVNVSEFVRSKENAPSPKDILMGGVNAVTSKFMKVGELLHGETFGCITCLNGMPRTCSVASTACSEVQVLKLVQLDEILESASSDIAVDMLSFVNDLKQPTVGNPVDDLEAAAAVSVPSLQETAMNCILKAAEKAYGEKGGMFSSVRGATNWYTLRTKMNHAVSRASKFKVSPEFEAAHPDDDVTAEVKAGGAAANEESLGQMS